MSARDTTGGTPVYCRHDREDNRLTVLRISCAAMCAAIACSSSDRETTRPPIVKSAVDHPATGATKPKLDVVARDCDELPVRIIYPSSAARSSISRFEIHAELVSTLERAKTCAINEENVLFSTFTVASTIAIDSSGAARVRESIGGTPRARRCLEEALADVRLPAKSGREPITVGYRFDFGVSIMVVKGDGYRRGHDHMASQSTAVNPLRGSESELAACFALAPATTNIEVEIAANAAGEIIYAGIVGSDDAELVECVASVARAARSPREGDFACEVGLERPSSDARGASASPPEPSDDCKRVAAKMRRLTMAEVRRRARKAGMSKKQIDRHLEAKQQQFDESELGNARICAQQRWDQQKRECILRAEAFEDVGPC